MPLEDFFNYDNGIPVKREEDFPTLQSFLRSMMPDDQFGPVPPNMETPADIVAKNLGIFPSDSQLEQDAQSGRISDFTSEMGKRQRLDQGAGNPPSKVNPSQNFTLDDIAQLNSAAEGWHEVPGTESFMNPGRPGRYRIDKPQPAGYRSEADIAADELRSYNKRKYGGSGNYGGAGADVLTSSENIADAGRRAYVAGAGKRQELTDEVLKLEDLVRNAYKTFTSDTPEFQDLNASYKGLQGLLSGREKLAEQSLMDSTGTASKLLAPLAEMQKADEQKQQYGALAQMLSGKGTVGKNFPGGMSADTYGQLGKVLSAQREERRLDATDRSFAALQDNRANTRDDRANRPYNPSAANIKLNMQQFLPPGTSIAKIMGQDMLVKSGTQTPVPNGEMYIRQAIQKAQSQMTNQPNPAVVKNPAVQGIVQMMKARENGTLAPHQALLLKRFEENQQIHKQTLMSKGMDERQAAEQALILASSDVVGMR